MPFAPSLTFARAVAAAFRSGGEIAILVPTGIVQIAASDARGCGACTSSLLAQLPVTLPPKSTFAFGAAGRTYHATFARGGAALTLIFACHDAFGIATHTGRADAV